MKTKNIVFLVFALGLMVATNGLSGSSAAVKLTSQKVVRPDPDSTLGPIVLKSQTSAFAALGPNIPFDEWKDLGCTRLRSRDGSQLALLWIQHGGSKGYFSEIEVSKSYYVAGMPKSKPIIVDWPFVTESGIALGVHYNKVVSAKGRPTSKWSTVKNEVIKYELSPVKWSHPATNFGVLDYYAKYVFSKDSTLTAFSFGFVEP